MTLFGIVMFVKELQLENADDPTLLNCDPSSNVTVVNELQYLNAFSQILVTLFGITIEVNDLQLKNAP